ncbi:MAG: hypothetical protein ACUVUQ_01920 [Thermodesulfovibrionales bacterium]
MKNPIQRRLQAEGIKRLAETFLGKKNVGWWAIIYASLIFIVTGWLPDGIAELIRKEWFQATYKLTASVIILFLMWCTLKKAISYKGKIEVVSEPPSPAKVLAIFLSPLYRKLKPEDIKNALNKQSLSKEDLEEMLEGSEWEMPVKAIGHHSPKLKRLYVLTSNGPDGTHHLMGLFKGTINHLFPSLEVIELRSGGIDFENVGEVFDSIEELYEKASEDGIKKEDIMVDITGGQKTNSIAGAIATLSVGRKFQYVSTRDKRILSYDVGYFEEGGGR